MRTSRPPGNVNSGMNRPAKKWNIFLDDKLHFLKMSEIGDIATIEGADFKKENGSIDVKQCPQLSRHPCRACFLDDVLVYRSTTERLNSGPVFGFILGKNRPVFG